MRMLVIAIMVFACSVFFSGCSSKVSFDEVIGSYKLRYPYATEELQLNKDSTYVQTILIDNETTPKTNKGRWEFWVKESEVVLNGAVIIDDGFGKLKADYWQNEHWAWNLGVRKSFGKISLGVNPDLGFAFEKTR